MCVCELHVLHSETYKFISDSPLLSRVGTAVGGGVTDTTRPPGSGVRGGGVMMSTGEGVRGGGVMKSCGEGVRGGGGDGTSSSLQTLQRLVLLVLKIMDLHIITDTGFTVCHMVQ